MLPPDPLIWRSQFPRAACQCVFAGAETLTQTYTFHHAIACAKTGLRRWHHGLQAARSCSVSSASHFISKESAGQPCSLSQQEGRPKKQTQRCTNTREILSLLRAMWFPSYINSSHTPTMCLSVALTLFFPLSLTHTIDVLTHMSVCIIDERARSRAQQIK